MIYWYWFCGYILFVPLLVKSEESISCEPATTKNDDGLICVDCSGRTAGELECVEFDKNHNIPYDVEVIVLYYTTFGVHEFTFSQFEILKRVKMFNSYFVSRNSIPISGKPKEWYEGIYKHLFADTNLEVIEMRLCDLVDENKFVYPLSLTGLNLDNNNYTEIDLTSCEDLEQLNITHNQLEALPKFSDAAPPLRYLDIGYNPLNKVTVNDIAALCWLKTLLVPLDAYNNSRLVNETGKCECERIRKWTKEIKVLLSGLDCYKPEDENEVIDCSNYTLDEARKIRQNCIKTNTGISFVLRKIKRYKYRIMTVFLGLFIFALIVYMIYRIHRGTLTESSHSHWKGRQSYRQSYRQSNKATAAEEGEEEEEDKID